MGYAYKYGYGVKKARASLPCLTNAVFLTKSISETGIVNKLSGGDAKYIGSNCLTTDGTSNEIILPTVTRTSNDFHLAARIKINSLKNKQTIYTEGSGTVGNRSIFIGQDGAAMSLTTWLGVTATTYDITDVLTGVIDEWGFIEFDIIEDVLYAKLNGVLKYTYPLTADIQQGINYKSTLFYLSYTVSSLYYFFGSVASLSIKTGLTDCDLQFVTGETAYVFCTNSGNSFQVNGILTNIWDNTQDYYHYNANNGCSVIVDSVITPTVFAYVPFDVNGLPLFTEGDTLGTLVWYSDNSSSSTVFVNCETDLNISDNVANSPTDLTAWNRKDDPQPDSVGVRFFFRDILDTNNRIIGTDRHVIYTTDPLPLDKYTVFEVSSVEDSVIANAITDNRDGEITEASLIKFEKNNSNYLKAPEKILNSVTKWAVCWKTEGVISSYSVILGDASSRPNIYLNNTVYQFRTATGTYEFTNTSPNGDFWMISDGNNISLYENYTLVESIDTGGDCSFTCDQIATYRDGVAGFFFDYNMFHFKVYDLTSETDFSLSNIELQSPNALHLVFGEGEGNKCHDKSDRGLILDVIGSDIPAMWITSDSQYAYNYHDGFSFEGSGRIPARASSATLDVKGNVLTNPPIIRGFNYDETIKLSYEGFGYKTDTELEALITQDAIMATINSGTSIVDLKVYDNVAYWGVLYHSGTINKMDRNLMYTGISYDLKALVNAVAPIYYDDVFQARDITLIPDTNYFVIIEWIFDRGWIFERIGDTIVYTGNYLDFSTQETSVEACIAVGNKIYVSGRSNETEVGDVDQVYEYNIGTIGGTWHSDIATYVTKHDISAQITDPRALCYDDINERFIVVDSLNGNAATYDTAWNYVESISDFGNVYAMTKMRNAGYVTVNVISDNYQIYDNELKLVHEFPMPLDSLERNMSGIVAVFGSNSDGAEYGPIGDCLDRTKKYTNME